MGIFKPSILGPQESSSRSCLERGQYEGGEHRTQFAELYYKELLKIPPREKLQAGLGLLYQGMRKLPTKPHMLTNLVFWEITPGFPSALGISDANLRTGIFWGRSNKPVPCHSKVDHSLLGTSFSKKFSFPSAEIQEL